jgi:hypothetical protein
MKRFFIETPEVLVIERVGEKCLTAYNLSTVSPGEEESVAVFD